MGWVRSKDEVSGGLRSVRYFNLDTGIGALIQERAYNPSEPGTLPGFYFTAGSAGFGPYTEFAEAKHLADSLLHPYYPELP